MRKVKFRGKSSMEAEHLSGIGFDDGEWIKGNLIQNGDTPYIVGKIVEVTDEYMAHEFWVPVYPESVGQYAEVKDVSGKEIFGGDIVTFDLLGNEKETKGQVTFSEGSFIIASNFTPSIDGTHLGKPIENNLGMAMRNEKEVKVIGNIFDNPEMLEGDDE